MEKMLGFILDCSRNAVMKPAEVKEFASLLKKMGYNTLMLYTEDTYELGGHEFFGHFRGRYSKEELKELDSYCNSIGIELVPCIQTLAHLENMFKWASVYGEVNDCDNILLCGEDKTYELIEDMFKTVSQCFTTKKIHIGMDEAFRVGSGKYQKIHG
ncbi:MAG: family 20 glycosylhydrolase, partial [Oscillospiraceae bacterium]|nr:family 20 glycosylhydrolase [Oscillospiraceae bacterium]